MMYRGCRIDHEGNGLYCWVHEDRYDGPPNQWAGSAGSVEACREEIDALIEEEFEAAVTAFRAAADVIFSQVKLRAPTTDVARLAWQGYEDARRELDYHWPMWPEDGEPAEPADARRQSAASVRSNPRPEPAG